MKTDMNPYGSPIPLKPAANLKNGKSLPVGGKLPDELKNPNAKDYKVDLSEAAKAPSAPSAPSVPSLPDAPSVSVPKPVEAAAKDVAKDEAVKKAKEAKEASKDVEVKSGSIKKPMIAFITGSQWMFSPSKSEGSYAGVGRMAEAVEGARLYGWDQKEEIIDQIKKTHKDQPIIIVGHSLGGDTAKEVADALDSLEHNFRKVDLLVTLDAVGFNNDIVPQNVKEHLNVFGENDWFLNDGPHVARNHDRTGVQNILSPLDHTELDDSKEIQFEIVQAINRALAGH
ncbi:MAG: lysophospholipase [Bacteriovoracaceae bacterium]|nr:lysophospholipase [Bacteriovoracaceae bacterium]